MVPLLLERVAEAGHTVFLSGLYNVNIVGIRHKGAKANRFDDRICIVFKDSQGWVTREYAATTDPGLYWLNRPMNLQGTAVLSPGQYRGVYMIDKHRGKYDALCQRLGPVSVRRDRDTDDEIDWDNLSTKTAGNYFINIHRASASRSVKTVGVFSAGCQVIQSPDDFDSFMQIVKKSAEKYGNRFTYTLLEE
jgi:hypothetical protein